MGHESHGLTLFASPLNEGGHSHGHGHSHGPPISSHDSESGSQELKDGLHKTNTESVPFGNADCELHDNPAFHKHAEATTSELFYDLFFVANLTTFTSLLEINSRHALTAYIGFFTLLWLTWYQVSLYDVRFSTDSVFERCAKSLHFGAMVGFAVIGPQWKPGQAIGDYKIYRAFGLILMVSRLTLVSQYAVTLFYSKKYTKTRLPLLLVMGSSLTAAILYGALTPAFPKPEYPDEVKSDVYIAWYVIGICETILTVAVSCFFRVISFKGTHMVQRMSLLTLIILGEGIIVICKAISKIVKNEYLWTAAVVGQIVCAIMIIYFLYMLYFDRMQEEHFGSIKQQLWSFLHFPLHTTLVLVLQGISNFVVWYQAIESLTSTESALIYDADQTYDNATALVNQLNQTAYDTVFGWIPKGVDASKERKEADVALKLIGSVYEDAMAGNETALAEFWTGMQDLTFTLGKTILESLSISAPKKKGGEKPDPASDLAALIHVFQLIFVYVFVAGGLALVLTTILGFLSLPAHQRRQSEYARLGANMAAGIGLSLIACLRYNDNLQGNYLVSPWMIPTLCLVLFGCVVINHVRIGGKKKGY
ncbi:hypothetical protein K469DRAFT_689677 [Zopfia rhizophila CBS 207.26]|uniref:Low temperature requirement A n=1 Tax=Zopfia rhizophila CBS 207.26 TaxID=1314779 RepID=A0A6A6E199_9PEZI|nr:hypothetical protein K469DRAFT_689677 [Zopfia rhizophila CBS 207.26]